MQIHNNSTTSLIINDLLTNGYPTELAVGASIVIFDEDAEKSANLKALITSGAVTVTNENIEPIDLGHGEEQTLKNLIPVLPFVDKAANPYLILATDTSIRMTSAGNPVATLPVSGLKAGQVIRVSNGTFDAGNVTINAVGGPVIGNSGNGTSDVLWAVGSISTFMWSGTQWWVVSH